VSSAQRGYRNSCCTSPSGIGFGVVGFGLRMRSLKAWSFVGRSTTELRWIPAMEVDGIKLKFRIRR